jgi:hypothetical protein
MWYIATQFSGQLIRTKKTSLGLTSLELISKDNFPDTKESQRPLCHRGRYPFPSLPADTELC